MVGIVIVSKFEYEAASTRLVASTDPTFQTDLNYSDDEATDSLVVRHEVSGLSPDTDYYYTFEINGSMQPIPRGKVRTRATSPASFKFAFSSCARSGSDHPVFDDIRQIPNLRFFLHLGDLHYSDINTNDAALYEAAYDAVLASPRQRRLYQSVPTFYMWDDHDYGPNNSDGTAPGRTAAVTTFRRRVPHPPTVETGATDAPYYSFVYGRCRFIVTDLRSMRSPNSNTDNSSKTMMGTAQKAWFKDELLAAKAAGEFVFWVRTVPWLVTATGDYSFSTERVEIANFIKSNSLADRIAILSADRHAMGIDDGTNSDYATGGGAPVKCFLASPMDQSNLTAMGTYSEGVENTNEHQYGIVTVTDTGGSTIGIQMEGVGYGEGVLLGYSFTSGTL